MGLSINQDTGSTEVAITDTDRLETIGKLIEKLVKEKKEPDLRIKNKYRNKNSDSISKKRNQVDFPNQNLPTAIQQQKKMKQLNFIINATS